MCLCTAAVVSLPTVQHRQMVCFRKNLITCLEVYDFSVCLNVSWCCCSSHQHHIPASVQQMQKKDEPHWTSVENTRTPTQTILLCLTWTCCKQLVQIANSLQVFFSLPKSKIFFVLFGLQNVHHLCLVLLLLCLFSLHQCCVLVHVLMCQCLWP